MSSHYEIRKMRRDELDFAIELAAKEGWNPGIYDADCFYSVDSDGFLIGLLDGQPISCISVVKYANNYSFLGFYIVKEGYRDKGYGYKIWQEGMAYLDEYNIGLDGVLEQVDKYKNSGFELSHENARYMGYSTPDSDRSSERIINLRDIPIEMLTAYDTDVFKSKRQKFLELWISRPETISLGIRDANDSTVLSGYGVIRKCREGYKVGPLFANSYEDARLLFSGLTGQFSKPTQIFIDVLAEEKNPNALQLTQEHNMSKVFSTARMYHMANPHHQMELPLEKWFGVTTFELG
ncbi:MAG: GNAT family N-acetyltransferase [Phototrophicaceae bacterium]